MSLWHCNDLMRALKEYVANERINIRRKFRENETKELRSRMQARITERLVSEILNTEEHFSKKIIQNEKPLEIIFDIERIYNNDW